MNLLLNTMEKFSFKALIKKKIISYWEEILRREAHALKSLQFFKPQFMSLIRTHPLLSLAGNSPSKVSMAIVQIMMLSGKYHCEALVRHWQSSSNGKCKLSPLCDEIEDLTHILQWCDALELVRAKLLSHTEDDIRN